MNLLENQVIENVNYKENPFLKAEYDNCIFNNCDFSNADISTSLFIESYFNNCNFNTTNIHNVVFRSVKFKGCKLMGIAFQTANEIGLDFSFDHCILDHSSFFKCKVRSTIFSYSSIKHVDFSGADLTGAVFHQCDLEETTFDHTNLEKVDFTSAFNYNFNLDQNKVKNSKHSAHQIGRLLEKYKLIIE